MSFDLSQVDDFASGNLIDAQGETAEANLDPAGATGNTYTVHYYVSVNRGSLTIAIDANDGAGWVERATYNYTNCSTTSTWSHEQRSVVISGLGLNDDIRLRAKSFAPCTSPPNNFAVRGGDAGGSNPETYNGITYTTPIVYTTISQSDDFDTGNLIDAQGETADANVDPATATGNTYTVHYYATVTRGSLTLAIDANDGSGWVERATFNHANSSGTSEWSHEQRSVVISGLGLNDDIRLRAKSFVPISSPPNTFAVRGGDAGGSNPETYTGVTYLSSIVLVTPDGEPVIVLQGSGFLHPFSIYNPDSVFRTSDLAVACTGAANTCSVAPNQVGVGPGQTVTAAVTYSTSGTVGATGNVKLTATVQGIPGASDTGSIKVTVAPSGPVVERDLCLTIAVAPGAAFECGDLRLVHAVSGVRTFNTPRAPTLLYNSQHAHPYPLVQADATVPTGPLPDSVRATLVINSETINRTWPGSAWASGGQTRRVVIGYDAAALVTGLYDYTLTLTKFVAGSGTPFQTANGSIPVINRAGSPFGAGWWLAGYERLYFNVPSGQVLWVGGDGSVRRYERTGTRGTDTVYLAPRVDRPDTLLHTNGNEWVRLLPGGSKVTFTANGIHRRTTNRLGYRTEFFPDSLGDWRLLRIQLPPDTTLTYDFGYAGNPSRLATVSVRGATPGVSRVTTLTWVGDSLRVKDLSGTADSTVVVFQYQTGGTNRIVARRDRRRTLTTFTYDAGYRLASSRLGVTGADSIIRSFCGADVRGLAACSPSLVAPESVYTRFDGARLPSDSADITDFWLDRFGAPSKIRDPYGNITSLTRGDPRWPALATRVQHSSGRIIGATYDALGNVATVADSNPYNNGQNPITRYAWDQIWDQLMQITLPNGQLARLGVNASNGNRDWVQDARGSVSRTTFQYHTSGNGAGLLSTIIPPTGAQTTITYDVRGNTASVEMGGWTTFYQNDSIGRTTVVRTPIGSGQYRSDTATYDVASRPVRASSYAPVVGGAPAALLTTHNSYDEESNLFKVRRVQSPNPTFLDTLTTEWIFDAANRPRVEIAPDGYRDSTWYDPAGNVDSTKTRNGSILKTTYDRMNRPRRRVVPAVTYPARTGPGLLAPLYLAYDNYPTTHPYPWWPNDGSGLKIDADTATFAYDAGGRLITADNRDARVHRTYFKDGNAQTDSLWIRNYASATFGHVYGLRYTYDLNGRPTALHHPAQLAIGAGMRDSVRYVYNDTTGAIASVHSLLGNQTSFLYNLSGQLVRETLPGGIVDSMVYDALGRLTLDRIANGSTSPYKHPDSFLRNTTLQYAVDPTRVSAALNTHGWKDTVTAAYSGLGHLTSLTYARPQDLSDSALYVYIGGDGASQTLNTDPLGNAYGGYASKYGSIGYGESFSGGSTKSSSYGNGTGRIVSTVDGGGAHGFVYDSAGNTVFLYQSSVTGNTMNDRASWYGADGRLRVAEWREAFKDNEFWLNPGWTDVFEEYRYDALGRRVLVMSRQECMFGADSSAFKNCQVSRVRRTVWDGARELWEIQMPARTQDSLLIENDTATVTYWSGTDFQGLYSDPNPLFGRVAYTYAGRVDQPVSLTRLKLVRRKTTSDTKYWNPVELQPNWNWRGEADVGTFADGGMETCTDGTHCVFVQWRSVAFATGLATELLWTQHNGGQSPYGWFGTLIHNKVDGTGTFYRRNRYVDPMTGRFTQEDPIGLAGGLNMYGFAGGDPVNFSDPFGLCERPKGSGIGICIESFIRGLKWGSGNARGPRSNGGGYKTSHRVAVDRSTGAITPFTDIGNTFLVVPGRGELTLAVSRSSKGGWDITATSTDVRTLFSNNLVGPSGGIDFNVSLHVSPNGDVELLSGGMWDGFPSLEIWIYPEEGDPYLLLETGETSLKDLRGSADKKLP